MTKRTPDLTRRNILQAAFHEIHRSGFQGASLENILSKVGVTKGALYHHFPDKKALGYAVIEELLWEYCLNLFIRPLQQADDPVDALLDVLSEVERQWGAQYVELGCPLNNLSQEMSPLDEGFRTRLNRIYGAWRSEVARALENGQRKGFVRPEVAPFQTAAFVVAAVEGIFGTTKNAQSDELFRVSMEGLKGYIATLRWEREAA